MLGKFGCTLLAVLAFGLPSAAPSASAQEKPPAVEDAINLEGIIKETQRSVTGKDQLGIVWWIPTEFWEQAARKHGSSVEQARHTFEALRSYTVVAVAIGKLGIGNVNWYSEQIIRSGTTLRDSGGANYTPLTELSGDAGGLVSIVKPMFSNMLGPMGQNIQLLFFPGKSATGKLIADPLHEGDFTVRFSYPEEKVESQYQWRLPLTSLSPPRFCPVGHERVQADWKFCPWHGNRLDEAAAPASPAVEPKKKDDRPI
jgi:hypothetical protein